MCFVCVSRALVGVSIQAAQKLRAVAVEADGLLLDLLRADRLVVVQAGIDRIGIFRGQRPEGELFVEQCWALTTVWPVRMLGLQEKKKKRKP